MVAGDDDSGIIRNLGTRKREGLNRKHTHTNNVLADRHARWMEDGGCSSCPFSKRRKYVDDNVTVHAVELSVLVIA